MNEEPHEFEYEPPSSMQSDTELQKNNKVVEDLRHTIYIQRRERPYELVIQSLKCGCDHFVEWIRVATGFHDDDCPLGMHNRFKCNVCQLRFAEYTAWNQWKLDGNKMIQWQRSTNPEVNKLIAYGKLPFQPGRRKQAKDSSGGCPYFLHPASGLMNRPKCRWKLDTHVSWQEVVGERTVSKG